MEHGHTCVYCGARSFCYEDCAFAGPAACQACSASLTLSTPRRVIPLRRSWVLDHLTEHEAERLRQTFRRGRPQ